MVSTTLGTMSESTVKLPGLRSEYAVRQPSNTDYSAKYTAVGGDGSGRAERRSTTPSFAGSAASGSALDPSNTPLGGTA